MNLENKNAIITSESSGIDYAAAKVSYINGQDIPADGGLTAVQQ